MSCSHCRYGPRSVSFPVAFLRHCPGHGAASHPGLPSSMITLFENRSSGAPDVDRQPPRSYRTLTLEALLNQGHPVSARAASSLSIDHRPNAGGRALVRARELRDARPFCSAIACSLHRPAILADEGVRVASAEQAEVQWRRCPSAAFQRLITTTRNPEPLPRPGTPSSRRAPVRGASHASPSLRGRIQSELRVLTNLQAHDSA